jgi:hypothetical protein
MLHIAIDW